MSDSIPALSVTSTTFEEGATLPRSMLFDQMGVGGENLSPQLSWTAGPAGTKSYAITLYDPDAPTTVGFWHWLLSDLDPATLSIPQGAGKPGKQPPGSVLGYTDFGGPGYGGMAPPPGDKPHRYQFNVYAVDKKLGLPEGATGAYLMFNLRGATLAQGRLTGLFGR
jgi:Raf kinase inhibitor-like YbhB/YbcL family protein